MGCRAGLQSGAAERGCRAGLERGIARQAVTAARTDGTCVRSCPYESRDSLSLSLYHLETGRVNPLLKYGLGFRTAVLLGFMESLGAMPAD